MAKKSDKNPDITFPEQKIVVSGLTGEMKDSYIAYAMSVIVGRALPDVRDGLKPVHRRILYSMYENNLTSDKPFRKSATAVGDVMGRYHPHGDASIYDALVRLAQEFSMRYPLVSGHGNFGSVDGDPAAAMRYTEARLSRLSDELLRDIDKDTVDWDPNYDETRKEPRVLPSRFPNLLVNGSSGIAVGMTTNIPPHNLTETINAAICVLKNPDADLDDLMEYVKGPDFPTRGIIQGRAGIRAAYATGRGRILVRARADFEEFGQGRTRIIVTELPYQVNKKTLLENIAELVRDKRIDGISGMRDETDRDGMRIVIELRRDANAQVTLNRLFTLTQLQATFAIVMLALVDDQSQPRILSLRQIFDEYLAHQRVVIIRRTQYDLGKARERAHLLEGLRIACDNIDEVIRIIRAAYNDAAERLMERFGLSEIQVKAILEMQLRRLQGLEREKIEEEYNALQERIAYYLKLLGDAELQNLVLIEELEEIRDKYGDERKTEIATVEDEIDIEDLIDEEECVYTLTNAGYIKRQPANTYRAQRRGGRGITAMTTREEDYVDNLLSASTHDYILFFTNRGRAFRRKGYMIPEAGRTAKGTNIVNLLPIEAGERVTAMIRARMEEASYLVFITRKGTVKRMHATALKNIRNVGLRAINLSEDDELISVRDTDGEENILIATHDGAAICFKETDLRPLGRTAAGVRGIRLRSGDYCIGAARAREGGSLLTVTENGYGKRTDITEYLRGGEGEHEAQSRGGLGKKNYNITAKTGKAAAIKVVTDSDDVLIIADDGTIIRMDAAGISTLSRSTQGVRLMKMNDGAKVIAIARTDKEDEIDDDLVGGGVPDAPSDEPEEPDLSPPLGGGDVGAADRGGSPTEGALPPTGGALPPTGGALPPTEGAVPPTEEDSN
ncbi:MAG: DNA gyrase subunit A [Oscillospiraceae bacterium]|jgi:DNA gyrase subunit A|nr:DNA gyrase subunit A [Oscillospiraceae bacterium]